MLSINNISFYIGSRAIYKDASLHIKPKDKLGLVGRNGTGKSTLLKLIVGEYQLDEGIISKSKDCSIGFLNQDLLSFKSQESILKVAMEAFKDTFDLQKQIDKVLAEMESNYSDQLVDKLSKLQERFEEQGGYSLQAKAEEILEGIGFSTFELNMPLENFSGGWRMRVMLAKLLLEKPSLLLLDEPTNHLDLPSIEWLENYIKNYEGAVVVISHDQAFLNNVTNKTVEVAQGKLNLFSGNYDFYIQEREIRREVQQNAFENQQSKIKQTEKFIEKFRAKATKARQVQSKIKGLEKMDMIEEVESDQGSVSFDFSFNQESGRYISTLKDLSKRYGEKLIFESTDEIIEKGDKIALIGANGKGKSTLLRMIAKTEDPDSGTSELGYNVNLGFYAQHQLESLSLENEILDELKQAGTGKTEQELRGVLGCFLFTGDDIYKKIKILSGGEKSRVALAKTLIGEANFLMLDEPTNHLDIQSINVLIQALQQYKGSYIVISHNRDFIEQVANKIWYIEDHKVKSYPGTFHEYQYWRNKKLEEEKSDLAPSEPKEKKSSEKNNYKNSNKNASKNALRKLQRELEAIEEEIHSTEEKIESIENDLGDPSIYDNSEKIATLNEDYTNEKNKLDKLNDQWENIALEIESIEQDID
ncbi:ABC-F family ATP-binding cassette domain-containing protein [Aureibacter tunicatorum]|uniref:ATP-binding cassette subfamily F protein 3 n=1 Tax=Aureibacter tunicatorum TaxID=866807 RepID=A0AAE3XIJ8_9BACT|nr:ABC-F family ATP-binding cassette domain-containing protein [Aureibacter tunicatorum]MDR6238386.1 ATP-binding cassette subfamily F protein 3 [Aureibacter tunicatorum]BDD03418.1 glycosyl transferase family 2 [Aureibacter tunicatorum]